MRTMLEELLADIATEAVDPARMVRPPASGRRMIEVVELEVIEERALPPAPPRRVARGTAPRAVELAAADRPGFIDMRALSWAHRADTVSRTPVRRRVPRVAAATAVIIGVAAATFIALSLLDDLRQVASEPRAAAARSAAPVVEVVEVVVLPPPAVREIAPAAPAELAFPTLEIRRIRERPDVAPPPPPAEEPAPPEPEPLALAGACYEAACASIEANDVAAAATELAASDEPIEPDTLPARPHASAIANAVVAIQDQLDGCGDAFGTRGAVRLKLRIAATGAVESITVMDGGANFRICVADAVRRVRLPPSAIGTTASFDVRVH